METSNRTTKKKVEVTKPVAPKPSGGDERAEDSALQEALEETFPASDSISPYIKPAK